MTSFAPDGPRPRSRRGDTQPDAELPLVRPVVRTFSDIEPEEVPWLWLGRIPRGRLTLFVGVPGGGKSFVTCDLAARISTGRDFPDGAPGQSGDVILIACEDGPGDTIRPRLDALGADPSRVHLLEGVSRRDGGPAELPFTLRDIETLTQVLDQLPETRLVVIDPIGSYLGSTMDANRENEVRSILQPLADLARRYDIAILLVAHRRKGGAATADETVLGSRAFTGLARSVMHLMRLKENPGRRLLMSGKINVGREMTGLAFRITGDPATIQWEADPITEHVDEILARENPAGVPGPRPEVRASAEQWLSELLANGPLATAVIEQEAKDAGFAWRTMQRAMTSLGVKSRKSGFGAGWQWHLEGTRPPP